MIDIVAPLLGFRNSGTVSADGRHALPSVLMGNEDRRAKVTAETKKEAKLLAQLWATRSHPSQAEFGETYGIGNQSAVGQFLRGVTPLSLKAARGFAEGLGCTIADFSPRLAQEAAAIATSVPGAGLSPEVAALAAEIEAIPQPERDRVLRLARGLLEMARESVNKPKTVNQSDVDHKPLRRAHPRAA